MDSSGSSGPEVVIPLVYLVEGRHDVGQGRPPYPLLRHPSHPDGLVPAGPWMVGSSSFSVRVVSSRSPETLEAVRRLRHQRWTLRCRCRQRQYPQCQASRVHVGLGRPFELLVGQLAGDHRVAESKVGLGEIAAPRYERRKIGVLLVHQPPAFHEVADRRQQAIGRQM